MRPTMAGVAAAKRGRARTEKAARRENILESEVCELQKTLEGGLLRPTDVCGQPFIRIPLFSDLPAMYARLFQVLNCSRTSWLNVVLRSSTTDHFVDDEHRHILAAPTNGSARPARGHVEISTGRLTNVQVEPIPTPPCNRARRQPASEHSKITHTVRGRRSGLPDECHETARLHDRPVDCISPDVNRR